MKIIAISGSLRRKSLNRGLLVAMEAMRPDAVQWQTLEVRLPLYDGDLDVDDGPAEVAAFKQAIADADAVIIATPEYNYGIPGPLKNALDWASRPAYRSVFAGKKVAIVGASLSGVGTARAQGQLKQVLLGMASEVFPHPEVLVGGARGKFDDASELTDEDTRAHLRKMLDAFVAWVEGGRASEAG